MTIIPLTQKFLDENQYSELSITKYESVFGRNFISPGGEVVSEKFITPMQLQAGMHVVDVGCGLGGPAFLMAERYGVNVHGLDLSSNMIQMAKQRLSESGLIKLVRLEEGDFLSLKEISEYDVVHSRDVFLHIHDKTRLFKVIQKVLKPGGRLYFSDYCLGKSESSRNFEAYVQERNYRLHSVDEYTELLEQAGFINIKSKEQSEKFLIILLQELNRIEDLLLEDKQFKNIHQEWKVKMQRTKVGEQSWGWFSAVNPL